MAYKSITQAQAANMKIFDGTGEDINDFNLLDSEFYNGVNKLLYEYGLDFGRILAEVMDEKNVTASGNILKNIELKPYEDKLGMEILLPDYYDYPNQGVKGYGVNGSGDDRNAPNSPYFFKSYKMSKAGRENIKKYIESGRAKITTIQNDTKGIQGSEKKKMSLIDLQTNTLIYWIKRKGIKATHYLDIAIAKAFEKLPADLAEMIGEKIKINIIK